MAEYHRPDAAKVQALKDVANKIRIHSIESTTAAGSGHPTSSCSMAEIMSVLFFDTMKYTVASPRDAVNDRLVLSKGHACPALYGAWVEAGLLSVEQNRQLRKIDNDLEGHPTPRLNFIDVATGSLGQGLSVAAGMAYTGKYFDKSSYRVFCIVGDGESAEGSIWEAIHFSSHYKLDNLVLVIDCNRLGQSEATSMGHNVEAYQQRLQSFGWNACVVDGHDVEALAKAFYEASTVTGRPTCIVAKTLKGAGIPNQEDKDNFHGKPIPAAKSAEVIAAINARIVNQKHKLQPANPVAVVPKVNIANLKLSEPPKYELGQKVHPRLAYGTALAKIGKANPCVVAIDGDTKNSTYALKLKDVNPDQYVECFIAEQNMVGVGVGLACRDRRVVFCSTFAAFLSRAYDQIRMAAVSFTKVNFVGSHCGVSIGEDGPSQMALEDLAMFRAIPGCAVLYPSDAVSMERAVELVANYPSMSFIRSTRADCAVLYGNDEVFELGKAKIVKKSDSDQVTLIGAGVTLTAALEAANELAKSGINCRVIDPFSIKPLDEETILTSAKLTGGRVVVVEDHYYEGGLGEAVKSACSTTRNIVVRHLAVGSIPRSGPSKALLSMFEIDATAISKAVKEVLKM